MPPRTAPPPPALDPWKDLVSFRAPVALQLAINARAWPMGAYWRIHAIEKAFGPVNLDYYPVRVRVLPTIGGHLVTPDELLTQLRLNLNHIVDTNVSEFAPYDSTLDGSLWNSTLLPAPLGAVIHIDMKTWLGFLNPDDGSVVVTEAAGDHWIFSTLSTTLDLDHPVSGNRRFGFVRNADGSLTFYTRGTDRCTGVIDLVLQETVFAAAHALWVSFQLGVANFINTRGGSATVELATSERYDWDQVKAQYYAPTVAWAIQP